MALIRATIQYYKLVFDSTEERLATYVKIKKNKKN